MKCPKCHIEVCNQRICPYCGATVFLEDASLEAEQSRFAGLRETAPSRVDGEDRQELLRRIQKLEIMSSLNLVLGAAAFVLMILLLAMQLSQI